MPHLDISDQLKILNNQLSAYFGVIFQEGHKHQWIKINAGDPLDTTNGPSYISIRAKNVTAWCPDCGEIRRPPEDLNDR